jgi:hypothetical protein
VYVDINSQDNGMQCNIHKIKECNVTIKMLPTTYGHGAGIFNNRSSRDLKILALSIIK